MASPHPTNLSWEGDKMFNIYIYDYCSKRGFRKTARELLSEAQLPEDSKPPINAKQGLLFEWWSVFWVLFTAKSNMNPNAESNGTSLDPARHEDAILYNNYQGQQQNMRPRPGFPMGQSQPVHMDHYTAGMPPANQPPSQPGGQPRPMVNGIGKQPPFPAGNGTPQHFTIAPNGSNNGAGPSSQPMVNGVGPGRNRPPFPQQGPQPGQPPQPGNAGSPSMPPQSPQSSSNSSNQGQPPQGSLPQPPNPMASRNNMRPPTPSRSQQHGQQPPQGSPAMSARQPPLTQQMMSQMHGPTGQPQHPGAPGMPPQMHPGMPGQHPGQHPHMMMPGGIPHPNQPSPYGHMPPPGPQGAHQMHPMGFHPQMQHHPGQPQPGHPQMQGTPQMPGQPMHPQMMQQQQQHQPPIPPDRAQQISQEFSRIPINAYQSLKAEAGIPEPSSAHTLSIPDKEKMVQLYQKKTSMESNKPPSGANVNGTPAPSAPSPQAPTPSTPTVTTTNTRGTTRKNTTSGTRGGGAGRGRGVKRNSVAASSAAQAEAQAEDDKNRNEGRAGGEQQHSPGRTGSKRARASPSSEQAGGSQYGATGVAQALNTASGADSKGKGAANAASPAVTTPGAQGGGNMTKMLPPSPQVNNKGVASNKGTPAKSAESSPHNHPTPNSTPNPNPSSTPTIGTATPQQTPSNPGSLLNTPLNPPPQTQPNPSNTGQANPAYQGFEMNTDLMTTLGMNDSGTFDFSMPGLSPTTVFPPGNFGANWSFAPPSNTGGNVSGAGGMANAGFSGLGVLGTEDESSNIDFDVNSWLVSDMSGGGDSSSNAIF